ncbi:MAG TPA: VacJ family lipoprotein [Steroidobacteraceae bacterium]|nr:VacJ family lipoprotein [Steroidobacteraceae bacterium]
MAATLVVVCGAGGCASLPPGSVRDPRDHFERFNRAMFKFDMALDRGFFRPVARGYVKVVPGPVRTGVSNFLNNIHYTVTIGNDLFQGQFRDFANDVARLIVNTTLGVGGLLDPASSLRLADHDRDFGQTLGKWGIHTGSYLVLPLLGPSDIRDAIGRVPDRYMTVDGIVNNTALSLSLFGVGALDTRAQALPSDSVIDSAFDPYAFVRSAWFQHRDFKVHEGDENYVPNLPPLDPGSTH